VVSLVTDSKVETDGTCRNCATALPETARYCSACGQSTRIFRRPWLQVFREVLDELFDLDGRMLVSFRLLLTRPGELARDYNAGRRAAHTSPVRMYLLISVLFFLVLPAILPPAPEGLPEHQFSMDLYSRGMFLLLPIYALILKLFYRRHFYLEHLVFTAYLFSAMFIAFGIMMAIEEASNRYLAVMGVQFVILIYALWYLTASLRVCYGGGWGKSALKVLGILLLFLPVLGGSIEIASHWEGAEGDPVIKMISD
jgi:hypothetical protein